MSTTDTASTPSAPSPGVQPSVYDLDATRADPDGNGWLLQEIKTRLPGR